MRILVINGPNLNLLGKRDNSQYGSLTLSMIERKIKRSFPKIDFHFFQSNFESELCNSIQNAAKFDGILVNPGGFTHTSVALRDAMEVISKPIIEVHLSNLSARENFRKTQLTTSKSLGYISGFKENSYLAGVFLLKIMIEAKQIEGGK